MHISMELLLVRGCVIELISNQSLPTTHWPPFNKKKTPQSPIPQHKGPPVRMSTHCAVLNTAC